MEIKILGPGCAKCKTLEKLVREVVAQESIDAIIIKVDNFIDIAKYNVMSTPALVVNDKVELKGRVPFSDEIRQILAKY